MPTLTLLLILVVVILVIIPVTTAVYRAWKVPKAWDNLQTTRGLENEADEEDDEPRLAGQFHDLDVEVWMDTDIPADGKSGPPHAQYTNIEVPLNVEDDSEICLQQGGVGNSIWRKVVSSPGGFDYKADEVAEGEVPEVDEDAFDSHFETAGRLSDALREALRDPAVRAILEEMLSPDSELHIERGTLRYTEPGRVSSRARLKQLVDDVVEMGLVVDAALREYHGEDDEDDDSGRNDRETPTDISA